MNPNRPTPRLSTTVWWSGNIALLVGTVVPWSIMLSEGRPPWQLSLYAVFALCAFAIKLVFDCAVGVRSWWSAHLGVMLALQGVIGLCLQSLSGDPYIQPTFFTVPLVYGALAYPFRRNALIGSLYLGLVALGLWINGHEIVGSILITLAGYGAAMVFMDAFTRLAVEQGQARTEADRLAADLAQQRDYLAQLVQITATLARELDLVPVLERVADAGRTLAQAGQARVWLREDDQDTDPGGGPVAIVRLAAAVPVHVRSSPSASVEAVLLHASAASSGAALVLPLVFKDRTIGALELADRPSASFTSDELRLLQPFADAAAVAIEHARLYEQARLSATLAERNRIARELHDTIAQGLTAVTMQLDAAQRSFERDPSRARMRLDRAVVLARETMGDVRRSVWTLAAPLVDGQALREALADIARRCAERTDLSVTYAHAGPPPTVGHAAATQVLRIVQETVQNVEKHAHATAVAINSVVDHDLLCITISDNGIGFVPDTLPHVGDHGSGFGLISLRERARLAGGTIAIASAPGQGTVVTVTINTSPKSDHEIRLP